MGCGRLDIGCWILDTGCGMWDAGYRMRDASFGMRDASLLRQPLRSCRDVGFREKPRRGGLFVVQPFSPKQAPPAFAGAGSRAACKRTGRPYGAHLEGRIVFYKQAVPTGLGRHASACNSHPVSAIQYPDTNGATDEVNPQPATRIPHLETRNPKLATRNPP